jgi:hypothetical protein
MVVPGGWNGTKGRTEYGKSKGEQVGCFGVKDMVAMIERSGL